MVLGWREHYIQNTVYNEIWLRVYHTSHVITTSLTCSQSQWPSGLRHGSAVAVLLDCGFEFCRGHGCLFLVERWVLSDRGLCGRSLVHRSPTECGVSNWAWSWILDNEEALAHWGLFRHRGTKLLYETEISAGLLLKIQVLWWWFFTPTQSVSKVEDGDLCCLETSWFYYPVTEGRIPE
jgi:hypothetical protein